MMWTPGDPSNYVLDAVQIHTEMGIFEGDDDRIYPHAVDQRSDWPEIAVECQIKFFR